MFDTGGRCVFSADEIFDSYLYLKRKDFEKGKVYRWAVQWKRGSRVSSLSEMREFSFVDIGDSSFYLSDLIPDYWSQDWGNLGHDEAVDG
ncbi:MAG: hypothetical protein DRP92_00790 [Candidatus Neomarinimicrobiota bacterium]|nr:hypothetical protein [Archaeoglobus sp.]RKY54505.1 MAG: hypothetical protein DRP92_00790 [Candidatus Neomarinimicrobiota bacterium]